jgi:hypothetical protein
MPLDLPLIFIDLGRLLRDELGVRFHQLGGRVFEVFSHGFKPLAILQELDKNSRLVCLVGE